MAHRLLRDVEADGWERADFPIIFELCLGDNPYVRMTKADYDKECKICTRAFTVFRCRPGRDARYKKTEVCQTFSKLKNVCQVCLLDLEYGLPVQVRDTALAINSNDAIPKSDVNGEYFAEEHDRRARAGIDYESSYGKARSNDTILKLQRTSPYYKRNRAHVCSFYVRGECTRGAECPYRHEMPITGELSQQNIKDHYYGYITSDCDAVAIIHENQNYAPSPEGAVASVLKAGRHSRVVLATCFLFFSLCLLESFICSAFPTLWVEIMAADSAVSLEQIKSQSMYDLFHIPIEVLFKRLKCTKEGLTSEDAANRLRIFGPNKLKEKKESKILKFLGFMWNPLSWVMQLSAIIAIGMDGSGKTPNWEVFMGIVVLLVVNSTISFIEENNAGNAAAALMAGFSPKTKVLRNGRWSEQEAAILVPGDIISVKSGDALPADARLLNVDQLDIDQYSLCGISFPEMKNPGDGVFFGSICKQGEAEAVVVATGVRTFFGEASNLADNTKQDGHGHLGNVLTAICNFCTCSVMIAVIIKIIVIKCGIQHRNYRDEINNLLVLMIGGIPIAMPTVLSITMAIGLHKLSEQGAVLKRMSVIEELAGMDVLCSDKTGTLTLNKLSVDRNLIEVFAKGVDKEHMILLAARASKTENQDAIDAAIVGMLADPNEARAGIREVHFLASNSMDKRTALTYVDSNGDWHRASKGSLEQIVNLCNCEEDIMKKVRAVDEKFEKHGLRSLAVARQQVPERTKESAGAPWQFVGLLPLFDPPRHDSAKTIRRALNLGVNVKMITGDYLPIAKETGRRLGMGTNMYPTCSRVVKDDQSFLVPAPFIDFIENADGFAVVYPDQKYEIVAQLQERKHICGMVGDGLNDAPALKKADIGIAVAGATDAARNASDIILTEPGLSIIISAVITSRAIFQRMKNYTIYAVSNTIRTIVGFSLIALIWKFDFSPFMVLIIAIMNDGTIMTIPRDRVKPSPMPDSWKLREIFLTAVTLGSYLALMTVIFFWAMIDTDFFPDKFGVRSLRKEPHEMMSALYLQVSIASQALIFITRSLSWSCAEGPGLLLANAFIAAQLVATLIAVYANWGFARIKGLGWGWAGVIWFYSLVSYLPLDLIKISVRNVLNGKAPDVAKGKDYGREEKEAQSPLAQRTLHGLQPLETSNLFSDKSSYLVQAESAEQAKRPVEVVQGFLSCTQGNVESVVELKVLDINTIQQHYTV